MTMELTSTPASAMSARPAATEASTEPMSPVMVTKAFPPSAIARRISSKVTLAALAAASAACRSVATLNDSSTPSAPVGSHGVVRPSAAMTSGWTLAMTKLSMRQPLAASAPAATADSTPAVSPPMSTMYLPEQMERERMSRTLPALSIVSATRNPAAMLDSSIKPMDFSAMLSLQNDLVFGNARDFSGQRSVQNRAHRVGLGFADDLPGGNAVAGFHFCEASRAGALFERQHEAARFNRSGIQRRGQVVFLDVQFTCEGFDGNMATVAHAVRFDVRRAGPFDLLAAHFGFGVVAGFLGIKFLGAGVERAKSARAAECGHLIPVIRAGGSEREAAHDLVWLDLVAEEKARAILGAITALVARRLADFRLNFRGLELAFHHVMVARQNDNARGSLCDGRIQIVRRLAHHQSADAEHGIARCEAACGFDAIAICRADGHAQSDG